MSTPPTIPRPLPIGTDDAAAWMDALERVMSRISAVADRDILTHTLAQAVIDECGAAWVRVWLYDPSDDALHLRADAGLGAIPAEFAARIPRGGGGSPIERALIEGEIVIVDAITPESGFRRPDWLIDQGVRSYAGFPLRLAGRLVGVLSVFMRAPWCEHALRTFRTLGQQAALALDHARVLDETHALQQVAAELAVARDRRALLDGIARRTTEALKADGCSVWMVDPVVLGPLPSATWGISEEFIEERARLVRDGHAPARALYYEMRDARRPIFVRDELAAARARGDLTAGAIEKEGIVSVGRIPLFAPGGDVIGMLILYHKHERVYTESEARLAQAFADQIAVAIHNVELAEQERRAREAATLQLERLTTLTQITQQLLGATELEPVLRVVVESASRLCNASGALVGLIDADGRHLTAVAAEGEPRAYFEHFRQPTLDDAFYQGTATGQALLQRSAVAVEDYESWSDGHELRRETVRLGVHAFVVAPLLVDGAPIGVLFVNDTKPRPFAPEDVALVQALADQAALAIEHARLLRRGHDAAVLEERARLARELHDSVTQSVFSAGLMARTAEAQQQQNSPALPRTLSRIREITQDALAEMRALLYELQPMALGDEGLAIALERLVAAMQVRTSAPIRFRAEASARLTADREMATFRIVQEALGNAAKYAGASAIDLSITERDHCLVVTVTDDGAGFDPAAPVTPSADGKRGGMGMRSMRERAAAAGLSLRIRSAPGAGTTVEVEAPLG